MTGFFWTASLKVPKVFLRVPKVPVVLPGDVAGVAVVLTPRVHQHQLPGPHGGRGGDVVDNLQLPAFSDEGHLCEETKVVGKS